MQKHFLRDDMKKLVCLSAVLALTFACQPLSADDSDKWRTVAPENLAVMTLPHGKVIIELAPQFSPNHVAQFKSLVEQDHYDGNKFYRVIDGFVAQAGPENGSKKDASVKSLKLEGDWTIDKSWQMALVQEKDLFAEQTGFKQGFALAANPSEQKAWLTHCPGAIAMARGNSADSATSHFYINNGQAPRYLDRIMTIFGRVVYGMNHVQAIQRTEVVEGDEAIDSKNYTPIVDFSMMADLPKEQQWVVQVENTDNETFAKRVNKRRERPNAFFFKKPPPVLDVCQVPIRTKIIR